MNNESDMIWWDFIKNPEWWVAFGTILLAIVAAFQDKIRSWFTKPKLECTIFLKPPDCHRTVIILVNSGEQFYSYYFRFAIWNVGNESAKNVEVMITNVLRKEGSSYRRIEQFTPDNLQWSMLQKDFPPNSFKIYCDFISPNTFKHCNLGHIHDPAYRNKIENENNPAFGEGNKETTFSIDVAFKSNALYYLLQPGEYRIEIKVGCQNASTISKRYLITITGKWFEDEVRMLNEGFVIKEE